MRYLKQILLIGALLLPLARSHAEIVVVDSIKYDIHGYYSTSARVIGYTDGVTDVVIPAVVYDCPVVEIADNAFYDCKTLTSISIPDDVYRIGYNAFDGCSSLKSVALPKKMNFVTDKSFSNCSSLTSIKIPDGVTYIGMNAFSGCSKLTHIDIPESVNSIDWWCFSGCSSLTSIVIPDKVEQLGSRVFLDCTSLKTVILSKNLKSLGDNIFRNCSELTSIVIPDKVETIGEYAFWNCDNLKKISLPSSIKAIGDDAFTVDYYRCARSITIVGADIADFDLFESVINENTLVFVDDGLFDDYSSSPGWKKFSRQIYSADMLAQKTVEITADKERSALYSLLGDSAKYIANLKIIGSINGYDIMALRNKTSHLLYLDLSEANIVANDDGYEYYTNCSLTEDNVLGKNSFRETNIISIILPESLKVIGNYAFSYCYHLETIDIPNYVNTIGENAFFYCTNLKEIDLPNSLQEIGRETFFYCLSLGPVLVIPDNVEIIESYSFQYCNSLDSVQIGKKVSVIDDRAFQYCSALRYISFNHNRSLKKIGECAFEGCSSLLAASLPYSVETIGNNAFKECYSLKSIKIPSMLQSMGNMAFYDCNSIESVYTYTIEPTSIGQNSFSCYSSATLYVPKTSSKLYQYNTQWSRFVRVREFEEPYDAFYLNGDYELDESTGRLDGEPDAEMFSTSGLIVAGTEPQTLNDIEIEHDGTDGATIIGAADDLTGSQVNLTANSLKVNISVDGNRWYFFCFPFDVERDSVECTSDCVWYSYDGNKRAAQGSGWNKIAPDALYLEKGVGYIYKASRNGVLSIHVNSDYLTFTANDEKASLNTYTSSDVANAHWNFIGNPFISYYDVQDLAKEYDAPIAIWNGTSYDVYRPGDDNYQLKPFEAFFVQKDAGAAYVEFLPDNRLTYNQAAEISSLRAARRAKMGTPMNLDRQFVNIVLMGQDSITDRTRIVYSVNASMDYEIGVDAAKFQADGVPQLYTLNGKTKYAINERPMGSDEIKLGYTAPKAGTYTLSVTRHDAEVEIYDNVAKSKVDFTFGDYSFQSQAGTFNDRFVVYKTSGGVTKVDNGFRMDGMTVKTIDGGIVIEGNLTGKVQVYSDSGMLLAEPRQAGRVELGDGVYIIKIGDKSIKLNVNRGDYAI